MSAVVKPLSLGLDGTVGCVRGPLRPRLPIPREELCSGNKMMFIAQHVVEEMRGTIPPRMSCFQLEDPWVVWSSLTVGTSKTQLPVVSYETCGSFKYRYPDDRPEYNCIGASKAIDRLLPPGPLPGLCHGRVRSGSGEGFSGALLCLRPLVAV